MMNWIKAWKYYQAQLYTLRDIKDGQCWSL